MDAACSARSRRPAHGLLLYLARPNLHARRVRQSQTCRTPAIWAPRAASTQHARGPTRSPGPFSNTRVQAQLVQCPRSWPRDCKRHVCRPAPHPEARRTHLFRAALQPPRRQTTASTSGSLMVGMSDARSDVPVARDCAAVKARDSMFAREGGISASCALVHDSTSRQCASWQSGAELHSKANAPCMPPKVSALMEGLPRGRENAPWRQGR